MTLSFARVLPLLFLVAACGRSALKSSATGGGNRTDASVRDSGGRDGGVISDTRLPVDSRPADRAPDVIVAPDARLDAAPLTITRLFVTPTVQTVAAGTDAFFTATAVFLDGSTRDVTAMATWRSTNPAFSVMAGRARGMGGTTTIAASYLGLSASATLNITAARLVGLSIEPQNVRIGIGARLPLAAIGTFSDGSKQDLTPQVLWLSQRPTVVRMAANGEAQGLAVGDAIVTATFMGATAQVNVSVIAAPLMAIEISPPNVVLPLPGTQQFVATGLYADGTSADLTTTVGWQSSDGNVLAFVGAPGLATTVGPGSAIVTARFGNVIAQTAVRVSSSRLVAIRLMPDGASVPVGTRTPFRAVATFADGTTADVTESALWSANNPAVASVSNEPGNRGEVTAVGEGGTEVLATLGGVVGTAKFGVTALRVVALTVSPKSSSVALGRTLQLTATALFADMSQRDVTAQAAWTASDPTVLAVSNGGNAGEVAGLKLGVAEVKVAFGAFSDTAKVEVTNAILQSISVAPEGATIAAGGKQAFTAKGLYSDGTSLDITKQVLWSVDAPMVATVSNADGSQGEVTGLGEGGVVVRAALDGKEGLAKLGVTAPDLRSISVEPIQPSRRLGQTVQFGALAVFTNNTVQNITLRATWTASNPMVVALTDRGLATCRAQGTATITATYLGLSDSTVLTCADPQLAILQIQPLVSTARTGQQAPLNAWMILSDGSMQNVTQQASWSSSAPMVAAVSNDGRRGLVRTVSEGTATITATYMGMQATATITVRNPRLVSFEVNPPALTLRVMQSQTLQAVAVYDDGTSTAVNGMTVFTTSSPNIADVSNLGQRGQVFGISPGTATITATFMGMTDTTNVTVTAAELKSLSISPVNARLRVGQNQPFQALAVYSDGSTQTVTGLAIWSTADPNVAVVTNAPGPGGPRGTVTALTEGVTTLQASYMGVTDTVQVTVVAPKLTSLSISPVVETLVVGQTQQFVATALYDDGSSVNVSGMTTWSSSDGQVASISNGGGGPGGGRGLATALAAGTTTITGSYMGVMDTATVTVTAAKVKSLSLSPVMQALNVGQTQQYTATAVYDDGTTQNVTFQTAWSSSDQKVADVSNGGPGAPRGQVVALSPGTTTITASYMGLSDTATLTVSAAKVMSVTVTPVSSTLSVGETQQLQATALYDNGTTQTVTGMAAWAAADPAIADVSNGGSGSPRGEVSAIKPGMTTVTANFMGVTGAASVLVTDAKLTSIQVTPVSLTLPKGAIQQFQAVGIYSDNTTRNLTGQAAWQSSAPTVADVANGGPGPGAGRGVVTAVAEGAADISATFAGISGKTGLTVSSASIREVQVTPTNPLVLVGGTQPFTATVVYSDFTVQNVTAMATWTSSDAGVAQVSNTGGRGVATGVGNGTATITATFMGQAGSTVLTVTTAMIKEIQLTPTNPTSPVGLRMPFVATAILADNAALNVTASATWESSDTTVVSVSNAPGSRGVATALKAGMAVVKATLGSASGQTTYTVGGQKLASISIGPATAAVAKAGTLQLTATGTYDDGSSHDLTGYVTWISSNPGVATVSNAAGSRGLATGVTAGMATVEAHFDGKTGTTALTVN